MSIYEIQYHFPLDILNEEFEKVFSQRQLIGEGMNIGVRGFYLMPPTHIALKIAKKCLKDLKIAYPTAIVNFMYVEPNVTLPWHVDADGTVSALNVVISENEDPLQFEDSEYKYRAALIDTSKLHRVVTGKLPRRIYRITFQDEEATFNNVLKAVCGGV